MRKTRVICIFLLILSFGVQPVKADMPAKERQLVYALESFDGLGYASSFAPASEETLYMLADQMNAMMPRYTMVYYWPLTRMYRADWDELNEPVEAAALEIMQGGRVIQSAEPMIFSVAFPEGYGSRTSDLYWGIEAEQGYQEYLEQRQEYLVQYRDYQVAIGEYQQAFEEYQDAMLDDTIVDKPEPPVRPEEPTPFLLVVTPPAWGFQMNLPEGDYQIRLIGLDGQVLSDSKKSMVVFSHRRVGIGYNIIPESRWTKTERSDDPHDTIYVDGASDAALYLQPFTEAEFREKYYRGLLDPQDHAGSEDRWIWAHLEEYGSSTMVLFDPTDEEELARVEEMPFQVVQMPGQSLGYQVVEYEAEEMGGQRPTFTGFELRLDDKEGSLRFQLVDPAGGKVEGSEREVRWIPSHRSPIQYFWLSFPLLVGLGALFYRRLWVSKIKKENRSEIARVKAT